MLGDRFPFPLPPQGMVPRRETRLRETTQREGLGCETGYPPPRPHQVLHRLHAVRTRGAFPEQLKLVSDCTERVTALIYKIATRTIRQLTAVFPRRVALSASSAEDQHS